MFLRDLEVRQQGMQQYFKPLWSQSTTNLRAQDGCSPLDSGPFSTIHLEYVYKTLRGRKDIRSAGDVNVGAHFLVDRDGTVHQLLPEDHFARHCIGVNHISIGIENVGGTDEYPLTDEQLQANVLLIQDLRTRHEIDVVLGHYEIRHFESHPYFRELNANYRSIKVDPGESFMQQLREQMVTVESPSSTKSSLDSGPSK